VFVTGEPTIKSPDSTPENSISADLRPVDYENPPVVETSFGFTFPPIKGWSLFHLGLLWGRLRPRYQFAEARLPMGSVEVDEVDLKLGPEVRLETMPLRSWFLDSSKNQLLQVQPNRFIRNWRAAEAEQKYFHYSDLKPMFQEDWTIYRDFLRDEKLPFPTVFKCDVTYINHLLKGREWNTLDDIGTLFKQMNFDLKGALVTSVSFTAASGNNQIRMDAAPGIRPDGTPIVQLTLNVSGQPVGALESDIWFKLDECHKLLVETFAEITADDLQKQVWKRIR
jgi:uncharacterized protein (TIGR04255 family)